MSCKEMFMQVKKPIIRLKNRNKNIKETAETALAWECTGHWSQKARKTTDNNSKCKGKVLKVYNLEMPSWNYKFTKFTKLGIFKNREGRLDFTGKHLKEILEKWFDQIKQNELVLEWGHFTADWITIQAYCKTNPQVSLRNEIFVIGQVSQLISTQQGTFFSCWKQNWQQIETHKQAFRVAAGKVWQSTSREEKLHLVMSMISGLKAVTECKGF